MTDRMSELTFGERGIANGDASTFRPCLLKQALEQEARGVG